MMWDLLVGFILGLVVVKILYVLFPGLEARITTAGERFAEYVLGEKK